MLTYTLAQPLIQTPDLLGECPLWDPARKTLFWIDIDRGLLHSLDTTNGRVRTDSIGQKLGCIALTQDERLLLATELGFASFNPGSSAPSNFLEVISPGKGLMFNDGKVSPQGEFWVGSKGPERQASLYKLQEDLSCSVVLDEITISNGIGWSSDALFFFHTDSHLRTIFRYNRNGDVLSDKKTFYTPPQGTPDGLSIDAQGNIWVAIWDGWRVVQLSPEGEELAQILLPVSRPTSVTFGGADLKTLYITSASVELSSTDLSNQPYAGSLFKIALPDPGLPPERFWLRAAVERA